MSEQEARRFFETLDNDEALQKSLEKLKDSPQKVVAEVQRQGFNCTAEELSTEFMEMYQSSMSEDQLNQIAAGISRDEAVAVGAITAWVGISVAAGAAAAA